MCGPHVDRQAIGTKRVALTDLSIVIPRSSRAGIVNKAWAKAEIDATWEKVRIGVAQCSNMRVRQLCARCWRDAEDACGPWADSPRVLQNKESTGSPHEAGC